MHGNLTSSVSVSVGDMAKTSLQLAVSNFQLPYLEPFLAVCAWLIFCISKHHTLNDVMCTGIQMQGPWGPFPNWFTEWLTGICRTSELVFILRNVLLFPCPMGVCCLVIWNLHFPKIEIKQSFQAHQGGMAGWGNTRVWKDSKCILTRWYMKVGKKMFVYIRQKQGWSPISPLLISRINWTFLIFHTL